MQRQRIIWLGGIGIVLIAVLAPTLARAGGWSVVTLDRTPTDLQAGTPFTVGFVVRQHGVKPIAGLVPTITLRKQAAASSQGVVLASVTSKGANDLVTVQAHPEGADGHYVATVTLPTAGTWTWQIDAFGPPAPLSPLQVAAPVATPPLPPAMSEATSNGWMWSIGLVAVMLATSAGLYMARTRRVGVSS